MMSEGTIVTFYSYKGGVGRTFALANIGAQLSLWGYRTLCIDWDLEAPGLHLYFNPWIKNKNNSGLTDFIQDYTKGLKPQWQDYISEVHFPKSKEPLLLMTAGFQDESYFQRMQSIDWSKLYESYNFGNFLEQLRESWKGSLDFVLIDSRTGITDIGGVCTIHLPDLLVLLLTANDQSLFGSLNVLQSIKKAHSSLPIDRANLFVLPVISRFEGRVEYTLAQKWLATFAKSLTPIYDDWLPKGVHILDLLNYTRLPYVAYWSFGEKLPVIEMGTEDPDDIGFPLETLAALVAQRLSGSEILIKNRADFIAEAKSRLFRDRADVYYEDFETEHALDIDELTNLASMYRDQGRFEEAEPLLIRALAINEKVLNSDEPSIIPILNNLASMYRDQGRFEEAEPLLWHAVAISEKALGSDDPSTISTLYNLAILCRNMGRNEEALALLQRAVSGLDRENAANASILTGLGQLYEVQGSFKKAEPLFRRALHIYEKNLGFEHPSLANALTNLSSLYLHLGGLEEAEPLLQRALIIREKALGPDHPLLVGILSSLGWLYTNEDRFEEAEPLLKRALAINEKALEPDHPSTANTLAYLGWFYFKKERLEEAEPLLQRGLIIREKALGLDHPDTANIQFALGQLYMKLNRYEEAASLFQHVLAVRERVGDIDRIISVLEYYHEVLVLEEQKEAAESIFKRLEAMKAKKDN